MTRNFQQSKLPILGRCILLINDPFAVRFGPSIANCRGKSLRIDSTFGQVCSPLEAISWARKFFPVFFRLLSFCQLACSLRLDSLAVRFFDFSRGCPG